MSATPEGTLANPEQRIADLQLQLAEREAKLAECKAERDECRAERDEALQRETASAEVLQVINSSPGELTPVFDVILEKAHSLCGAPCGSLQIYDGERFRAVATRGLAEPFAAMLREGYRPDANLARRQLLSPEKGVTQFDFRELQRSAPDDPIIRTGAEFAGIRTTLFVPLWKDQTLLGRIVAARQEVQPFTDKQIALLQNFAAQAVLAMENARLITETREALDQQTATKEVLQVINSSPGDLAPVFDEILEKAHSLCGADRGSLQLYDGEKFHAAAVHDLSEALADFLRRGYSLGPTFPHRRLLEGEPFIHVPDLAKLDDSFSRSVIELGGTRTLLWVALRKDDRLLGLIATARLEVRPFSDKQITLLQNFAAQAVIAMENARLIAETREALEQQTATAEVLQVINSSPGDLAPVFDAMLEKAMRLCEASFGLLMMPDGPLHRATAHRGLPRALAEYFGRPIPMGRGLIGRLMAGEDIAQVIDAADDNVYRTGSPTRRALVELGDARSGIAVALRKDRAYLGAFWLYRKEVRPFTDKQIALVQNFAAQAVLAMENARLITETREALEQQTATAEVLGVINSSPDDLKPVFDAILEKAHNLCDAEIGALLTYDGDAVRLAAERNLPPAWADVVRGPWLPRHDHPVTRIIRGERLFQIEDMAEIAQTSDDPVLQAAVELGGIRSLLLVPLRKDGSFRGYITAYRQEVRPFTEKQIALLENFAAQAVIAMENARLLGELRERTDEVAELNRGLEARVAEQVEELGRVGRLKRFLAPQLAELIVSQGNEQILESHRREIVVVFCDLRGYTAFAETAEPEEVLDFLREYQGALGPLVAQFEGTLDQFSGDGIMVFFNDPVPIPDPAERGVRMAVAMREAAGALIAKWRRLGRELGFGAGIAQGYATLGQIGFAERSGYTAIGTVCNLAARLCAEAKDGQILIAQRVAVAVEETTVLQDMGALALKGLTQPIIAYNVPLAASQPAFRVIKGGPPSV